VNTDSQNEEVQEFWKNLEEEIGEPITIYTLGEYRQGNLDMVTPKVGLFYTTDTALYFQTFPKANWFSALMGGFGKKKKEEQGKIIKIPYTRIEKIFLQKPSFMEKLFSPKMPIVVVQFIDMDEAEKEMLIATDEKGNDIVQSISAIKE
jgi:hypothetical protein